MKRTFYNTSSFSKAIMLGILLLSASLVQAQITITQASFASWSPGNDTFRTISAFDVTPSDDGTWDLGGATYGSGESFTRMPVSGNSTFPDATYSKTGAYSFNELLSYQSTEMNAITPAGIQNYGHTVERQPISLASLTGGANDSLIFDEQEVVLSSPQNFLAFPATAGSTFGSDYNWDLQFELSVAAFALENAPCVKSAHSVYTNTVVGWGKMRVENLAGELSDYMDVLAVKVALTQQDSFFMFGAPAPESLVSAFGLTQGQLFTQYSIEYYRAGEVTPLLTVYYTDDTYSTVSSAYVHAAHLPVASGINDINALSALNIFPNPANNGACTIRHSFAPGKTYSFALIDAFGRKVQDGICKPENDQAALQINQADGTYYLQLKENDRVIGANKIVVLQ